MDKKFFPLLTQKAEKYISGEFDLNQSIQSFVFENPTFNGTKTSISMYLEAFKNLITGKTYKRNINTSLHIFYLEHIKLNYPDSVFRISLLSTRGHLDYRFQSSGQRLLVLENYLSINSFQSNAKTDETQVSKDKIIREKPQSASVKSISIIDTSYNLIVVVVFFTLSLFNFFNVFRSDIQSVVNGTLFLLAALISILKSLKFFK